MFRKNMVLSTDYGVLDAWGRMREQRRGDREQRQNCGSET
jgi:hypothetical protein